MADFLKLRRDLDEPEDTGTLKFPAAFTAQATRKAPPRPRLARDGADEPRDGTVITSDELVRQIESTLDRMQNRLDRFKRQLGSDMKFPISRDDGPPPRTAA